MAEARFNEVETYVFYHHNTVAKYIATRTIMDLCLAAKQRPEPRVKMRWWEQEVMGLEGTRTAAQEAERTEGGEETDRTETVTDD